jgi:hypothetical protein
MYLFLYLLFLTQGGSGTVASRYSRQQTGTMERRARPDGQVGPNGPKASLYPTGA